jgi:hypothetical protein
VKITTVATGLAALFLAAPTLAWEREAHGCAAEKLACPPHLSADEVRLILGHGSKAEAVTYYDAAYNAAPPPAGDTLSVMAGTYQPTFSNYQAIDPRSCNIYSADPTDPGPAKTVRGGRGIILLEQEVLFPYQISETEFLLAIGLCGPAHSSGVRDLSAWVGPGARFWAAQPPEGANNWMNFAVIGPNGRIAHAFAGDHAVLPIAAGGRVESWLVTQYELVPGTGQTVEIEFGAGSSAGSAPPAPTPPVLLPADRLAETLWQTHDPCAALRRIAAALDMTGRGDLLPVRARDGDGPQACADLYKDLTRRLRGEPPPVPSPAAFLWTLP